MVREKERTAGVVRMSAEVGVLGSGEMVSIMFCPSYISEEVHGQEFMSYEERRELGALGTDFR